MKKLFGNITHVQMVEPNGHEQQEPEYFIKEGEFYKHLQGELKPGVLRKYTEAEVSKLVDSGEFVPLSQGAFIKEGQQVVMDHEGKVYVANFAGVRNKSKQFVEQIWFD